MTTDTDEFVKRADAQMLARLRSGELNFTEASRKLLADRLVALEAEKVTAVLAERERCKAIALKHGWDEAFGLDAPHEIADEISHLSTPAPRVTEEGPIEIVRTALQKLYDFTSEERSKFWNERKFDLHESRRQRCIGIADAINEVDKVARAVLPHINDRSLSEKDNERDQELTPSTPGVSAALRARVENVEAMREFCKRMIEEYCWGYGEPDGGDVQDIAEKLGLIHPHIATAEDVGDESEFEPGDTIYRLADWLNQPSGLSTGEAPMEQAVNTNDVSAIRSADKGGEA